MRKLSVLMILLGLGFAFFCSVVVVGSSVGIYIKKSPSLEDVYFNAGDSVVDLTRLLLTLNERYSLLLVGYSEDNGVRLFETMPALP